MKPRPFECLHEKAQRPTKEQPIFWWLGHCTHLGNAGSSLYSASGQGGTWTQISDILAEWFNH